MSTGPRDRASILRHLRAEVWRWCLYLSVPEKAKKEQKLDLAEQMKTVTCPVFLVLNKVDLLAKDRLLSLIGFYAEIFPFEGVIPISALTGDGTERLIDELLKILPLGPRYFPEDIPTDASERFLRSQDYIIRNKF